MDLSLLITVTIPCFLICQPGVQAHSEYKTSQQTNDVYSHLHSYHVVNPVRLEGNRKKRDLSTRTDHKIFHEDHPSF